MNAIKTLVVATALVASSLPTIALEKGESGGGVLRLSWENTVYSGAFTLAK